MKFRNLFIYLLVIIMLFTPLEAMCAESTESTGAASSEQTVTPAPELRGVWFSFNDWKTYLKGKDEAGFRAAFATVCKNTRGYGLNTIFLHVRSHNDAVYPSGCYPWSDEMLGGNPGFDPLSIAVECAHAEGLKLHAWINPYGYRNGKYCGDRSLATKENIIAGIREILDKYSVDGIHFDDYFPPLGASVHNDLLKNVFNTVHAYGKTFGVSPGGNIENNRAAGADVDTWLGTAGYVDYICPQIYWTNRYGKDGSVTMYSDRLAAWKSINKACIPMYIGLGAYLAGKTSKSDPGWKNSDSNLSAQVNELRANGCGGYILFAYSSIVSSACSAEMAKLKTVNK